MADPRQPEIDAAAFAEAADLQRRQALDFDRRQRLLQQAMSVAASPIPANLGQAMGMYGTGAAKQVGATAANMASYVAPARQAAALRAWAAAKRAQAEQNMERVGQYTGPDNVLGSIAAQALARLPGNVVRTAPEVANPVSKLTVPAGVLARFPQIASLAQKYGADAVNLAYHSLRGGAESGMEGAVVNPLAALVGENVLEPALGRVLPGGRGADIAGNVGGWLLEKMYEQLPDMSNAEIPIQNPPPRQMIPLGY